MSRDWNIEVMVRAREDTQGHSSLERVTATHGEASLRRGTSRVSVESVQSQALYAAYEVYASRGDPKRWGFERDISPPRGWSVPQEFAEAKGAIRASRGDPTRCGFERDVGPPREWSVPQEFAGAKGVVRLEYALAMNRQVDGESPINRCRIAPSDVGRRFVDAMHLKNSNEVFGRTRRSKILACWRREFSSV